MASPVHAIYERLGFESIEALRCCSYVPRLGPRSNKMRGSCSLSSLAAAAAGSGSRELRRRRTNARTSRSGGGRWKPPCRPPLKHAAAKGAILEPGCLCVRRKVRGLESGQIDANGTACLNEAMNE